MELNLYAPVPPHDMQLVYRVCYVTALCIGCVMRRHYVSGVLCDGIVYRVCYVTALCIGCVM